jgi:hypothetical protein
LLSRCTSSTAPASCAARPRSCAVMTWRTMRAHHGLHAVANHSRAHDGHAVV